MTLLRSPLEAQLHRIRFWMVVAVNLAFLLYSVVTTLVGPEAVNWHNLLDGDHKTRTFAALVAVAGLACVLLRPRWVRVVYTPYLLLLLLVATLEVRSTVQTKTMPFHLALWLSANMSVLYLVYGARLGFRVFLGMLSVIVVALLSIMPIRGYLLADWLTTLIVMVVSGATSFLLMSMIESNMLVNERTIEELRSAHIDAVTGVPGRAITEELLEQHLAQARAAGSPLSIVMADLDHFKAVNDQHGHQVGDDVLREFAERAREIVTALNGQVGRWGGEEFMVILPNHTYPQAFDLAERLCRAVNEHPFKSGVNATASFGVACVEGEYGSAQTLFMLADQALYEAKRTGRNKVG